jgi:sugar diacid utilization regulator
MTTTQAEIILALARNNLNVAATARELFMHYNNIHYHARMIHRNTGLNPKNFDDLNDLVRKAKAVLEGEHND